MYEGLPKNLQESHIVHRLGISMSSGMVLTT